MAPPQDRCFRRAAATVSGGRLADLPKNREGATAKLRTHPFKVTCIQHGIQHGIEHRLTKPNHPRPNGQVERMNRTVKDATVKRYRYDQHHQLSNHLNAFIHAYNFGRRRETLKGLTPYEFICQAWQDEPKNFRVDPIYQMPGLNS